jgi:hypothetical protein
MNRITRILATLIAPLALVLAGCAATPSSTVPTELTGDWSASSSSSSSTFDAVVTNDAIVVYLTLDESRGLYWSGTFEESAVNGQDIVSDADVEALEASLFGSQSEAKTFIFTNGEIVFEFTIVGVTTDVKLQR